MKFKIEEEEKGGALSFSACVEHEFGWFCIGVYGSYTDAKARCIFWAQHKSDAKVTYLEF